jgi:hypothetical protein
LITRLCSCCLSSTRQPLLTGMSPFPSSVEHCYLYPQHLSFLSPSTSIIPHDFQLEFYLIWQKTDLLLLYIAKNFSLTLINQFNCIISVDTIVHDLKDMVLPMIWIQKEQEQLTWLKFRSSSSNYTEDNNGHHVLEPLDWTSWFET